MKASKTDSTSKQDLLFLTDNSKTKFRPNHKNTFGLTFGLPENGGTCPGATTGPGGCLHVRDGNKRQTCYMSKVVQIYKAVGTRLKENTDKLVGKSEDEMFSVLDQTMAQFKKANDPENYYFRLHYSGDFFSEPYARAWRRVVEKHSDVKFWVYTRSHHLVQYLIGCTNLTVFLSVDPSNEEEAYKAYEQFASHTNVGMAWMGNSQPIGHRWVTCPETSGRIKNSTEHGACAKCRLCIDRYKTKVKNIQFLIH